MSSTYVDSVAPMDLGWKPFFDGEYFQPQSPEVVQNRRTTTDVFKQVGFKSSRLQDYQEFVELDWLKPHGYFRTVVEMEDHFVEEYLELEDANSGLAWDIGSEKPAIEQNSLTVNDVISELGDVLWFVSAFSTNANVNIETEWRRRLFKDKGVHTDEAELDSIDRIIADGYIPKTGFFELDEDPMFDLIFAVGFICTGTKIIIEESNEKHNLGVEDRQRTLGLWTSHAIGLVTLQAQRVGSSLTEVVAENTRKTSLRAKRKTLDQKQIRQDDEK